MGRVEIRFAPVPRIFSIIISPISIGGLAFIADKNRMMSLSWSLETGLSVLTGKRQLPDPSIRIVVVKTLTGFWNSVRAYSFPCLHWWPLIFLMLPSTSKLNSIRHPNGQPIHVISFRGIANYLFCSQLTVISLLF